MDEFQHFERLSTDADFEGGQWIGGEFVYTKRKKKAQQTEEERLYGYQGSSDDDEEEGFRSRKRKRQTDTRALHKGVSFVSSGVVTGTAEAPDDIKEEAKAAEQEGTKRRCRSAAGSLCLPFGTACTAGCCVWPCAHWCRPYSTCVQAH